MDNTYAELFVLGLIGSSGYAGGDIGKYPVHMKIFSGHRSPLTTSGGLVEGRDQSPEEISVFSPNVAKCVRESA